MVRNYWELRYPGFALHSRHPDQFNARADELKGDVTTEGGYSIWRDIANPSFERTVHIVCDGFLCGLDWNSMDFISSS